MTKPLPKRGHRDLLQPFGLRKWLLTGELTAWYFIERQDPVEEVWALHANDVVTHYARRFPGYRPRLWWRYSSPAPRRRVGGTGTPLHECAAAVVPHCEFGVPSAWKTERDCLTNGTPISASDPPVILHRGDRFHLVRHDRVER
jgi:hypothetical protein